MKKYLSVAVALTALAGAGLTSIPASAQDSIPGYASDGSVVAVPNDAQQYQYRARSASVGRRYDRQPRSDIPAYGSDGRLIENR